jgi:hypothetical protein
MKENPYSKMIEIMKKQGASNPPSIQIGEVIEPPPNLIIMVNDLPIDKENILIADYLLKEENYIREYQTSSDRATWGNINYIKYTDTLKKGELLAVIPVEDKQLYIILARLKEVS